MIWCWEFQILHKVPFLYQINFVITFPFYVNCYNTHNVLKSKIHNSKYMNILQFCLGHEVDNTSATLPCGPDYPPIGLSGLGGGGHWHRASLSRWWYRVSMWMPCNKQWRTSFINSWKLTANLIFFPPLYYSFDWFGMLKHQFMSI